VRVGAVVCGLLSVMTVAMAEASRGSIHSRPIAAVFAVFSMSQHAMQRKNETVAVRP
jgi:hypothetical protein